MLRFLRKYAKNIITFIIICSAIILIIRFFPRAKILNDYTFSKSFFSHDGKLLRVTVSYDDKYRVFYPLNEIPEQIQQAVLMYEDKNFYFHIGINPVSLLRAINTTFISKNGKQGASTITMQTVRILYNLNTKTVAGKIKQILLALWLEMRYSKKDILEAYFNTAPYGYNIEGIGAASLIYFNKRLKDLELHEQLTLAVIPQNPNIRRPSLKSGFEKMKVARKILYDKWVKKYPQSKNKEHFFNMPMDIKSPKELPFYVPHVINYLNSKINKNEIYTTIDLKLQILFEECIKKYIDRNNSLGI
ncbi:MAG: transglycosylase domain-containing protein, partial [Endomicrobiaceae bacterium]|nr:transglycosylase domain-containing protein [Endomicrobiaceae bacterium]